MKKLFILMIFTLPLQLFSFNNFSIENKNERAYWTVVNEIILKATDHPIKIDSVRSTSIGGFAENIGRGRYAVRGYIDFTYIDGCLSRTVSFEAVVKYQKNSYFDVGHPVILFLDIIIPGTGTRFSIIKEKMSDLKK